MRGGWKQCKFHAISSALVPTFYMRFVIDNHFSYITKFTYIVQSILVVNVTVSAMNVLPAGRLFFFFFLFVLPMVTLAWQHPKKHVDTLCRRAVSDVVVT